MTGAAAPRNRRSTSRRVSLAYPENLRVRTSGAAFQRLPVRGGAFDVLLYAAGYVLGLLLAQVLHALGGDADDEAAGWELLAFGDEGSGGHDRALAYAGTVQNDCTHPDEAAVLYLASV